MCKGPEAGCGVSLQPGERGGEWEEEKGVGFTGQITQGLVSLGKDLGFFPSEVGATEVLSREGGGAHMPNSSVHRLLW